MHGLHRQASRMRRLLEREKCKTPQGTSGSRETYLVMKLVTLVGSLHFSLGPVTPTCTYFFLLFE